MFKNSELVCPSVNGPVMCLSACVCMYVCNIAIPTLTPQQLLLQGFNVVMPPDPSVLLITLKDLENNLVVYPGEKIIFWGRINTRWINTKSPNNV